MRRFRIQLNEDNLSGPFNIEYIDGNDKIKKAITEDNNEATNINASILLDGLNVLVDRDAKELRVINTKTNCNNLVSYSIPPLPTEPPITTTPPVINPPTPEPEYTISIEVGAIFGGVAVAVEGGIPSWTVQYSLNNGGTWVSLITTSVLEPLNPGFNFSVGEGQINTSVSTSGIYLFRVIDSKGIISNNFTRIINLNDSILPPTSTPSSSTPVTSGPINPPSTSFTFTEITNAFAGINVFNRHSLDMTNMRFSINNPYSSQFPVGFDFYPTSAFVANVESFDNFTNWDQGFLAIPGTENNVVIEGNLTYYNRPQGYNPNYNNNGVFDFYQTFPEFTLPEGKMVVLQSGVGIRDTYPTTFKGSGASPLRFNRQAHIAMLSRGISHVKDLQETHPNNSMKFLGDVWMIDGGINYPADGTNPFPSREDHERRVREWAAVTDPQQIFNYWKQVHLNNVNDSNYIGNSGYYMWNFELQWAWPINAQNHFKAFIDLVTAELSQNYPNLKFAMWRKKAIRFDRIPNNPNYNYYDIFNYVKNNNLTPTQLVNYLNSTPMNGTMTVLQGLLGNNKVVNQVGFYQGYMRSKENPALLVFDFLLNKRASGGSTIVSTFWPTAETVGDFGTIDKLFTFGGNSRVINTKPRVGSSTVQTVSIWSILFGDGIDMWDDVAYNPDIREWLVEDPLYPRDSKLPNNFAYLPVYNVNWMACASWISSVNKDIIERPIEEWNFVNNNSFVLFSDDETQDPFIGWKLNEAGTEALVVISDFSKKEISNIPRINNVTINGHTYSIKSNYRFTTVCRIQLNS
jgi:hypothetical protein